MKKTLDNYHNVILEIEDYAILLLDKEGIIQDWNKGAEKLKGYTTNEIVGQSFKVFYTEEDRKHHLPEYLLSRALSEGKANDEGWRVRKDGSRFWGNISITAIHDSKNRVVGFTKVTHDLTEKKKIEEQLRNANALLKEHVETKTLQLHATEYQLQQTLETMLEGVQIHDFEWRYLYVNDALVKTSTYSREELIGFTLMEKYPGIEATDVYKAMHRCMSTRQPEQLETEFAFPDGSTAYFEISIQAIPQGISVLSVDKTEQHKAKLKLQKANRLYAFISAINQSIVHIDNEKQLLDNACKIATDIGLFRLAWIGMIDDTGKLQMTSMGGDEAVAKDVLRMSGLDPADPALQHIPTVKVLKTGKHHYNNDVQNDPALIAWRDKFIQHGIAASISLPITRSGTVIGVYGFHAPIREFFDREEIMLLEEAAGDISFALEVFDKEEKRKQADENLRRSESKLKDAQGIGNMGSWEVDMTTGSISWSDEHFHLLGYEKDEIVPSNEAFLSLVHPDDIDETNEGFLRTFTTLEDATGDFRMKLRDGTIKHVFCKWKFEFDDMHCPVRMYGITQDITEAKKAGEQQALFTSIVSSSDDAIISKNLDGIITSWNRGAEKTLGYTSYEAIGKHISMLIPRQLQGEEKDILSRIIKGESVDHFETERLKKGSNTIYVSLTISPIKDALGKIIGASKIMRDITDKKLAEAEITILNSQLQDANYQLSTIFNTLPANIALLDDKGQIIAVNKAWKQFANENELQTTNHCLGDNYIEVCEKVIGDDAAIAQKMAADMKGILQNRLNEFALEYPCHSPQEKRWFRAEVRPLTDHKDPGAVVMHFNITERKEAENEVIEMNNTLENRVKERTCELQEANNALEAFSYSVSHDLRAPVRAMIGFTSIIKKEYGEGFSDDLNELFEHIRLSSKRMNAIIDDMLTLAKYEKEKLHPVKVNMKKLFNDVWDSISFSAPHRSILQMDDLPVVEADGSMLQQVITNLLSNAIKYSSKKPSPQVHAGYEIKDSMVTFFVRDNGAGFDMKGYHRLFGAFQRLHGTSEFEGTGVGLLLVKKIIERHGGTVWAEGKVDEGATFYFTLPLAV